MITEKEFYKRKIFFKDGIPQLRVLYPEQSEEIDSWSLSATYANIQDLKSSLATKLKRAAEKEGSLLNITPELLYKLYIWWEERPKKCDYCGLTEDDMKRLHLLKGFINKRSKTRGYSLEIDRKQSDLPYDKIENLTLACYWCNNAKTDTFTYDEFKMIGGTIKAIWNKRLPKND